jgi:hypothetical protein
MLPALRTQEEIQRFLANYKAWPVRERALGLSKCQHGLYSLHRANRIDQTIYEQLYVDVTLALKQEMRRLRQKESETEKQGTTPSTLHGRSTDKPSSSISKVPGAGRSAVSSTQAPGARISTLSVPRAPQRQTKKATSRSSSQKDGTPSTDEETAPDLFSSLTESSKSQD